MGKSQENIGKADVAIEWVKALGWAAFVTAIIFIIFQILKIFKKPGDFKPGGYNPDKYFTDKGAHGSLGVNDPKQAPDYESNQYTLYDENNGGLNSQGKAMAKTIETEVYGTFYTSDSKILGAIRLLKTKGDWALFNDYWNTVVMDSRKGDEAMTQLPTKLAQEMFSSNYAALMDYINKLPDHV